MTKSCLQCGMIYSFMEDTPNFCSKKCEKNFKQAVSLAVEAMKEKSKNRSCPFCESTNLVINEIWTCVECIVCGAQGPFTARNRDFSIAWNLWNKRSDGQKDYSPWQTCEEERKMGNGGCGACVICCNELKDKVLAYDLIKQKLGLSSELEIKETLEAVDKIANYSIQAHLDQAGIEFRTKDAQELVNKRYEVQDLKRQLKDVQTKLKELVKITLSYIEQSEKKDK